MMHHPSNPNSSLACMLNDSKSDQIIYIVNRNLITHTHTHKHTYIHTTWKKLEIRVSHFQAIARISTTAGFINTCYLLLLLKKYNKSHCNNELASHNCTFYIFFLSLNETF
ncbi:hypothetical protein WN943_008569 [Citrus x changshan-huyou]